MATTNKEQFLERINRIEAGIASLMQRKEAGEHSAEINAKLDELREQVKALVAANPKFRHAAENAHPWLEDFASGMSIDEFFFGDTEQESEDAEDDESGEANG